MFLSAPLTRSEHYGRFSSKRPTAPTIEARARARSEQHLQLHVRPAWRIRSSSASSSRAVATGTGSPAAITIPQKGPESTNRIPGAQHPRMLRRSSSTGMRGAPERQASFTIPGLNIERGPDGPSGVVAGDTSITGDSLAHGAQCVGSAACRRNRGTRDAAAHAPCHFARSVAVHRSTDEPADACALRSMRLSQVAPAEELDGGANSRSRLLRRAASDPRCGARPSTYHDPARVPGETAARACRSALRDPIQEPTAERHASFRVALPASACVGGAPRVGVAQARLVDRLAFRASWVPVARSSRVSGGGIVVRVVRPQSLEAPVHPKVTARARGGYAPG